MSSLIEDTTISGIPIIINWWQMNITATYFNRTYTASFDEIEYPNKIYANTTPYQVVNLMTISHDTISVSTFPFRDSIHITIRNDAYVIAEFWLYEN